MIRFVLALLVCLIGFVSCVTHNARQTFEKVEYILDCRDPITDTEVEQCFVEDSLPPVVIHIPTLSQV